MNQRISSRFAQLRAEKRAALIAYVMAFDPDRATSLDILKALPAAGADIIEIGFPFTDPMADGPSIQKANVRALEAGATLKGVLELVRAFRETDTATPIVLMGYLNPIEQMGARGFAEAAKKAGVDGAIIVDLPPEEDAEVRTSLAAQGISLVRLATPTTDDKRLSVVLEGVTGFLYYVSVTGVTGARAIGIDSAAEAVARLKRATDLPVAVGFGVREPEAAAAMAKVADAVVVGSAFVDVIAGAADAPAAVTAKVAELSRAVRSARRPN